MMRVVCVLALVAGCTPLPLAPKSELPAGYVAIDRGEYDWRAMSADGVIFGARTFPRDPEGTAEFWTTVIRKELEGRSAWVLESTEVVGAGQGMLFATPQGAYFIAVFVQKGRIGTLEAGGPRPDVIRDLPAIKAHAASLYSGV
jgi:hypothetical protein